MAPHQRHNRVGSTKRTAAAVAALAALTAAMTAIGGPVDPPSGPIGPTGKTIAELEPRTAINAANTPGDATSLFRISQPGSYTLTGNLQGVAGKHGIAIAASGVTLDLNGFDVSGVAGSLDGISVVTAGVTAVTVRNGNVRGWSGDGVDLLTQNANNSRVADLLVSANTGNGVAAGTGCAVTGCSVFGNGLAGINTAGGCAVTACTTYSNLGPGIFTNSGCAVERCTSYYNDAAGISVGSGSTVADCTCRLNTTDGILATSACVISNNTCTNNGFGTGDGAGVHTTGTDNRIEGNTCLLADRGVDVDTSGSIIVRNTCSGNTSNWTIVAGNSIGPIVTAATNAASINGNAAAPSTLGTTDPFANFNY